MTADEPLRAHAALHLAERVELANLDTAPLCDFCGRAAATWTVIYRPCRHQHLMCAGCKTAQQQRQLEAIAEHRPLGRHGCCSSTVWRAGWIEL